MPYLGILEDRKFPHVPGTAIREEETAHSQGLTGGLKHDIGRNSNIVLHPPTFRGPK